MKKYFLFCHLFLLSFIILPQVAFSAKKYRYIKREHGVRFQGNIPTKFDAGLNMTANLQGAYAYNWKGLVEAGPYFSITSGLVPFSLDNWQAGILGEYNIIKNRGKRHFVPAVGVKLGMDSSYTVANMSMGVYTSLKLFVSKRTPFIVTLGYNLLTPLTAPFTGGVFHNIDLSMGFSYYFDFY